MVKLDITECSENISTIFKNKQQNISITVSFSNNNLPHFKVFDNVNYFNASREICILFKHCSWFEQSNNLKLWKMNEQEKQRLVQIFRSTSPCFKSLTNWQVALYKWNIENLDGVLNMANYFAGIYDNMYTENPNFIPSTLKMPNYLNLDVE